MFRLSIIAVLLMICGCSGSKSDQDGAAGEVRNPFLNLSVRRDPTFDKVQKGVSEDEVLKLLSEAAWSYTPKASGVWTFPRVTIEEFHKDPDRIRREIQEVLFVYFRDGKVDNTYRITGEEFARPRPGR